MPFWKQSDDPWDRKPRPPEAKEPKENPIDNLKQWNEERKAAARERQEAKRLPPEKCPWCGKEMEQGYLLAGRDPIRWYPGVYKFTLFPGVDEKAVRIDTQGDFTMYRVAWLCRECRKMTFDMPEPAPEDGDAWYSSEHIAERLGENETKEEESGEE